MKTAQRILSALSNMSAGNTAYAHCDVPCGIYDPHRAIIGALTVLRMMDIIDELGKAHAAPDAEHLHSLARAVAVKEEHAEIVKNEVRIIWGDYFKPEHKEKFPELDGLVYKIMQVGSKSKQTTDRKQGMELLTSVNRFAEIFWDSKGKETKKVKAPYKPEEEIVVPVL